jgi:hypothetical protein
VIGGVAKPSIEGWILALRGVQRTDAMSRARVREQLLALELGIKSTDEYVGIVEQAVLGTSPDFGLPSGAESLRSWLARAHEVLDHIVVGIL